jgi:hypothetical protein
MTTRRASAEAVEHMTTLAGEMLAQMDLKHSRVPKENPGKGNAPPQAPLPDGIDKKPAGLAVRTSLGNELQP